MNRIKYCVAGSLLAASMLALTGCGSYDVNIRVEPIPAEEVADNMNTIRIHVDADDVGVSVDNGIEVSAGTFAETAEMLGHSDTSSVHKYTQLDAERMRLCPLSLSETGLRLDGRY